MSYPHTENITDIETARCFCMGFSDFSLTIGTADTTLIEKITEMVERWEANIYRCHLGQCSHLEQVAQDVGLSFDYHQRWPLWPTWFQSAVNHNIFFPLGFEWDSLHFNFCPLSLVSFSCHHWEESDSTFLTPLSYAPVCQFLSCVGEPRPGQITGDVSHQCWVKGKSHLSQPAAKTPPTAAQVIVGPFCCRDTLLAHIQLGVQQTLKALFCKLAFQAVSPQHS